MNKFILGLVPSLIWLAPAAFGADPVYKTFMDEQNVISQNFFGQQAKERGDWISAHQDIIRPLDEYGAALWEYKNKKEDAEKKGVPFTEIAPTPPAADPLYTAFMDKQRTEKNAFLAQQGTVYQDFLNAHPGIDTSD